MERFPWWAGFAWIDFDTKDQIVFPIPFNWLMRWARNAYLFLKYPSPHKIEEIILHARSQAIQEMTLRSLDSYNQGYKAHQQEFKDEFCRMYPNSEPLE